MNAIQTKKLINLAKDLYKKELMEVLSDPSVPDDTPILLSKDEEGNGYHYVCWADLAVIDSNKDPVYEEDEETLLTEPSYDDDTQVFLIH